MKLDTSALRYLTNDDWRVLTAVETGSRNHEVVPTSLIISISGSRGSGSVQRSISTLAKANLIAKVRNVKYDGYRLTYGGLDYLALHAHQKHGTIYSVGNQIGVGKESDIFVVADESGKQLVLKIHRLGRISFRSVKSKRDYLRKRSSASWMYMSRLAAIKEFAFMQALSEQGLPVPEAIGQNRHTIVMSLVNAFPLRQISSVPNPGVLYGELMELILWLAALGLIHGDFNEFNILVKEAHEDQAVAKKAVRDEMSTEYHKEAESSPESTPIMIDFPQMVSIDHANAEFYFDRDVTCVKRYFGRRYGFVSDELGPSFADGRDRLRKNNAKRIDVAVEASGFSRKMAKELQSYMEEIGVDSDRTRGEENSDSNADEDSGVDGIGDEGEGEDEGEDEGEGEDQQLKP